MTNSEDDLESWQNQLYELHGHSSTRPTKSLRWLSSQPSALPYFDGSTNPDPFIVQFSGQIPEPQKMTSLELALRVSAARWWKSHKPQIPSWEDCQRLLRLRFKDQPEEVQSKFDGKSSPQEHLAKCYEAWKYVPQDEWAHRFVHTLEPIAKNWYEETELRLDTVSWDCLVHSFIHTFSTNDVCPALDAAIRILHTKVFDDRELVERRPDWIA